MCRRLFNALTLLSLLLFVAVVGLWVRSYGNSDFIHFLSSEPAPMPITSPEQRAAWDRLRREKGWDGIYTADYVATAFSRGTWYFFWGRDGQMVTDLAVPPPRLRFGGDCRGLLLVDDSPAFTAALAAFARSHVDWVGFSYVRIGPGPSSDNRRLGVPAWSVSVLTSILPVIHLLKSLRARRRVRRLQCTACGYDLRATPGRCPECGTVAAKPATQGG